MILYRTRSLAISSGLTGGRSIIPTGRTPNRMTVSVRSSPVRRRGRLSPVLALSATSAKFLRVFFKKSSEFFKLRTRALTLGSCCCKLYYINIIDCTCVVTPTSPPYVEGSCPTANWVPWGSHCYYFTTYNEDVTTWNSAQAICTALAGRNFNGSVASITSEAENRFIYNSIVELGWTYSDAWIGLKQISGID